MSNSRSNEDFIENNLYSQLFIQHYYDIYPGKHTSNCLFFSSVLSDNSLLPHHTVQCPQRTAVYSLRLGTGASIKLIQTAIAFFPLKYTLYLLALIISKHSAAAHVHRS